MGTAHKHSYRFVFLKSDKWKDVRYEALAREQMLCQICNEENFNSDAHHIFYPKSVWDTEADDLVILCRPCHEFCQILYIQQSNREKGLLKFNQIVTTVQKWVNAKAKWAKEKINGDTSLNKKTVKNLVPFGMAACRACFRFDVPLIQIEVFKHMSIDIEHEP